MNKLRLLFIFSITLIILCVENTLFAKNNLKKKNMNIEVITLDERTKLAHSIAEQFNVPCCVAQVEQFADSEIRVSLAYPEQFAGKTVLFVQSTSMPVQQNVLAVAFLAHELKNAGAQKVIGIIPYFGFSRQEASDILGKPGQAQVVALLFEAAGIDAMIMAELHTDQVESFFSIPIINVRLIDVIAQHIKSNFETLEGMCLVAPDEGARDWVESIAKKLGVGSFTFTKKRYAKDATRIVGKKGECIGTTAIIIDDIIATGGTAFQACDELLTFGFQKVYGYFVHPVLAGDARAKVEKSAFEKVFVSNSIPLGQSAGGKLDIFDITNALVSHIRQMNI